MVKSSLPELKSYPTSIINFAKTKWVLAFFLVPIGIYTAFLVLGTEITNFIIPFFPVEPDKSFGFYRDFVELCFNEILWLSFFLFLTWVFLIFIPLENVIKTVEKQVSEKPVFLVSLIIGLSFFTSIIISYYTLKTFPNSADEYVYLIQAETLSHGKLWQSSHELYNFFHFNHIAQKDDISVGRFPPGWPLLLSIPFIFKIPAFLINPVLGLFSLIMFYSFVRRLYTLRIAIWSLVSLALTSFFIFNSASFFSHTSCLLITLGFVYCIHLAQEKPSIQYGLAAGIFLGMIVITRSFNAVLIFIPVSIYLLHRNRLRSIPVFFWIGIGTLPFFLFLFWYNDKITGNGLLPVTVWADSSESLGFVHGHSFIKGIDHFIRRVFMFLYWCSPALLILYFIFLWRKIWDKTDRLTHPEDYYFLLLIIGYFFYHHIGGNQYGPRF